MKYLINDDDHKLPIIIFTYHWKKYDRYFIMFHFDMISCDPDTVGQTIEKMHKLSHFQTLFISYAVVDLDACILSDFSEAFSLVDFLHFFDVSQRICRIQTLTAAILSTIREDFLQYQTAYIQQYNKSIRYTVYHTYHRFQLKYLLCGMNKNYLIVFPYKSMLSNLIWQKIVSYFVLKMLLIEI